MCRATLNAVIGIPIPHGELTNGCHFKTKSLGVFFHGLDYEIFLHNSQLD